MKYGFLNKKSEKKVRLDAFLKGVDSKSKKSGYLEQGRNIFIDGEAITSRAGITPCENGILDVEQYKRYGKAEYFNTDTTVYHNGKEMKVAYIAVDDYFSNYFVCVFLIDGDGKALPAGVITFGRSTDNIFFIPESITFFAGKSQTGGGLFAFANKYNRENPIERDYSFFEINADFNDWWLVTSYYTPTVCINGRGNFYENAKALNDVYLQNPKSLEGANMLTGRFNAYYSSDGLSNLFKLPYGNLASAGVKCRIYTSIDSYTDWLILEGQTSDTKSFFGSDVTMNVNRQKGIVYFTTVGANYSIPIMSLYNANNICISATVENKSKLEKLVSCKICKRIGSKLIFTGGHEGSKLYYCDFDNPTYFPVIEVSVGASDPILALESFGDTLFAFKENEIYSIKGNEQGIIDTTGDLADNNSILKEVSRFSVSNILRGTNGINPKTLKTFENELIWQDKVGKIWCLKSSGKITRVCEGVEDIIKEKFLQSDFAKTFDRNYLLCKQNQIAVMDIDEKAWYFWDFPSEIKLLDSFKTKDLSGFVCYSKSADAYYTALQNSKEDAYYIAGEGKYELKKEIIKSVIITNPIKIGFFARRVRITKAFLKLKSDGNVKVCFGSERSLDEIKLNQNDFRKATGPIRLNLGYFCSNEVYIMLESEQGLNLSEGDIYYIESAF